MSKVKGARHNTWSHHETMILNLRDWVNREINVLRSDLAKESPSLAENDDVMKTLKSAEGLSVQVFDMIRSVVDLAEKTTKSRSPKKIEAGDGDPIEG